MSDKNIKTISIWEKIEERWPAKLPVSDFTESTNFSALKSKMENFLLEREASIQSFSHFGFVVNNVESSIDILKTFDWRNSSELKKVWVEAYSVYVGRIIFDGKELEFISPAGESFFKTFLNEEGEGFHHIAFKVDSIDSCLGRLKKYGVESIDKEPRSGSHGKIAFLMPGLFGKMCIELFQQYK